MSHGLAYLPELAVIEVAGDDRIAFVHGQLTNHIQNLGDAFRLAGYCTPQGRLQATMRVYAQDDKLFMVIARDLVEGFMKRFGMFILRSKVTLRLADELKVAGVTAPTFALPEVDRVSLGDVVVARVADVDGMARCYVIGSEDALNALGQETQDTAQWWAGEVKAGLPWVVLATKEAFVPQWINMDLTGGLVFNKGCYPGQEIISRVQHIGSTPRRSVLMKADAALEVVAGDDVMIDGVANGKVVMAATVGEETWAFAQVPLKALEAGSFEIKEKAFTVLPLPYAMA